LTHSQILTSLGIHDLWALKGLLCFLRSKLFFNKERNSDYFFFGQEISGEVYFQIWYEKNIIMKKKIFLKMAVSVWFLLFACFRSIYIFNKIWRQILFSQKNKYPLFFFPTWKLDGWFSLIKKCFPFCLKIFVFVHWVFH
jgi:hypothetical protein